MELVTILLSGLLTGLSVAGIFVDNAVESRARSRLGEVDQLEVRIENVPSYSLLRGEVDQIRLASRGVQLTPNIRLDALEIESDPLNIDLEKLRSGEADSLRTAFNAPLQAGVRVVMTEADLNQALQSPRIQAVIEQILDRVAQRLPENFGQVTGLTSLEITLLENGRIQFQGNLQLQSQFDSSPQEYQVMLETGLEIVGGQQIQLVSPRARVNGRPLPPVFLSGFASQFSNRFNLSNFDKTGTLARLLQLKVEDDQVEVAAFVRVESLPDTTALNDWQ
jgi:hypothetical protein